MPNGPRNLIADVWKSAKDTIERCFHRHQQLTSSQASEKVEHTTDVQDALAAPQTVSNHHDHVGADALSSPSEEYETQQGRPEISAAALEHQPMEEYDFCDTSSEITRARQAEENATTEPLPFITHTDDRLPQPPVTDNIRHKLRETKRKRANVRHEKIGIEEQTNFVHYKLEELNEAINALQDAQHASSQTERLDAVQRASVRFTAAADKLAVLQQSLLRSERRLDEVETDLQQLMDEFCATDNDDNNSIHSESDANSSNPDVAYSEIAIMERPPQNDLDSINDVVQMPVFQRSNSTRQLSEHNVFEAEDTFPYELDSELTNLALSDCTVQSAGDQFSFADDESGTILPEEYDLSKDNVFVRLKRSRDLASIPELWPLHKSTDTTNFDHSFDPDISLLGLGHKVSFWILQYFACSWLEFSRYVCLARSKEPIVDQVIVSFGYFHLSSLIYANWFCDDTQGQVQRVFSIEPSISNASNDVPRLFHQIFIRDSDDGTKDVEYIQLPVASNIAQPGYSERPVLSDRLSVQHSTSSSSSKASSRSFDRPKRMDTLLTDLEDTGEPSAIPCTNNDSSGF